IEATLDLAILPFCAVAIPAALAGVAAIATEKWPIKLLALIPVVIGTWVLTFTSLSLLRPNYSTIARPCQYARRCASAPYSLVVHECRDHGRCSPMAIARALHDTLHKRAVIERVGNPETDLAFDERGVVRDAVSMIETWAGGEPTVTVLIGHGLSDLALMYTGKWHR